MQRKFIIFTTWCCLLLGNLATHAFAAEETTISATTTATVTTIPTTTTTPTPILANDLCKKCSCDKDNLLLDCSTKLKGNWFSDAEWDALQNGDIKFDTINLEHNNLTTVPVLRTYPVKHLYLGYNQIATLAIGAFQNTTNLTKLDLSHNNITSKVLKPDVFRGVFSPSTYLPLESLRELDLGYNDLHNLDDDLFEHLPNLESLVLCKNTFHKIDTSTEIAIAGLMSLKLLDMSYMELSAIPDNFFHGPRDLETLILTGNLFRTLPDQLQIALKLRNLQLDENLMANFSGKNVFPKLTELQYLSISYMPDLTEIGEGGLSNLQNLTTLIANENPKLSTIDSKAFGKATTSEMYLDYPPITELHLNGNNLTVLDRDLLVRWDKVTFLDLRSNPWNCDCENYYLIESLMKIVNQTHPLLTKNVQCASPAEWKSVSLMDNKLKDSVKTCEDDNNISRTSLIFVGLIVGLLIGIPLTMGTIILYRRGCFGLLNRQNNASNRALYNRASFNEDFHI